VTLVVADYGLESLWLLTDRRLSCDGVPVVEDARKVFVLDAADGVALLGYAGLGATALGTEPSDWMARVVRGPNLPLEVNLALLAEAIQHKFPPHLAAVPPESRLSPHHVIAPAFRNGEGTFYMIDLLPGRDGYTHQFGKQTGRVLCGGSGASVLTTEKKWARELVSLVDGHDRGQVSAREVATYLAMINHRVHTQLEEAGDRTVGSRCIVSYRFRQGGGGQEVFDGLTREENPAVRLPTVSVGMDINNLADVALPHMIKMFEAYRRGETAEIDKDAMNADLARMPHWPDDTLD
jgi:hypothetical protein